MELLLVPGGLITLVGLGPWLGRDSRERSISDEKRFAKPGFAWGAAGPESEREKSSVVHRVLQPERMRIVAGSD